MPTQTVVVLGRSSAVAIGVLAIALVIMGGMIGKSFLVPSAEVVEPAPATEAAPDVPDHRVALKSIPEGAEVERGGLYLGHTPLSLSIPDGEVWELEIAAEGFESKQVALTGIPADVTVKLVSLEVETVTPPPPQPRSPKPDARPPRRGDIADPWGD